MKHIAVIVAIVLLGCVACSDGTESPKGVKVYVFKDTNGCEYLIWSGYKSGGMTPRTRPDGTQECGQPVLSHD